MKKKSSKAKMIVADASASSQIVTALQGTSQQHQQQAIMGRTQTNKLQPSLKGSRPSEPEDGSFQAMGNEIGQNVFLQDSRLSHTMTRGYQQQMQSVQ